MSHAILVGDAEGNWIARKCKCGDKMKVIILINESVSIESIDGDDEHVMLDIGNADKAKVNINDLKLALRKMAAK